VLNKKIFTPGPVQVHPEVMKAVSTGYSYHRSSEFKEFHGDLISNLKQIFLTKHFLNILTTSGTGSMETAVINFCSTGDNVLFLNQGRFGARWGAICKAFGLKADDIQVEYGDNISPEKLQEKDLTEYSAVFLTHSETSTATISNIKGLAKYIKANSSAMVIVDAITSIGAIEFRMDDWNVDVAVSASQKGLMTPPGLSVIAYNDFALERMQANSINRYYFDLRKELESQKDNFTSWTPAISLMYGLKKASEIILKEGLEKRWRKTSEMADYFRANCTNAGFGLLSKHPSDSLTALTIPNEIPTSKIIKALKDKYGIQVANGQAELNNKIFRVSHMGDLNTEDIKELTKIIIEEFKLIS
jgi:serine---pyruvate transaminase